MRISHPGLRSLAPALLLGLAAALAAPGAGADAAAPDFTLPNLQAKDVCLSKTLAGGPVLLSFWATWCVPCPQEMKHLQRFHEKYGEQGLTILGISIDGTKTVSKVKGFVNGRRITFPILLDTNNSIKRLYQLKAVPTLYLLRPDGEIVYHHVGYRAGDESALEKEIQKVLAAAAAEDTPAGEAASEEEAAEATDECAQPK